MRLLQAAVEGIPGDARLIAASYDQHSQEFTLILESRRFPETDMRRGIPEWPVGVVEDNGAWWQAFGQAAVEHQGVVLPVLVKE